MSSSRSWSQRARIADAGAPSIASLRIPSRNVESVLTIGRRVVSRCSPPDRQRSEIQPGTARTYVGGALLTLSDSSPPANDSRPRRVDWRPLPETEHAEHPGHPLGDSGDRRRVDAAPALREVDVRGRNEVEDGCECFWRVERVAQLFPESELGQLEPADKARSARVAGTQTGAPDALGQQVSFWRIVVVGTIRFYRIGLGFAHERVDVREEVLRSREGQRARFDRRVAGSR